MKREKKGKETRRGKTLLLHSKRLWAPVLLLILFVLLYISAAPYGVFTAVPSKEAANSMLSGNVQLQQTAQMNLLEEKKIFTKENIRITDPEFQQQLKTFLSSRYGINANDMKLEKSLGTVTDKKFVYFTQVYKSVPVYGARSAFFIRNNKLAYMVLNYHKIENLDVNPVLPVSEGFSAAKRSLLSTLMLRFAGERSVDDNFHVEVTQFFGSMSENYYDISGKQRERDFSGLTTERINSILPESSELVIYPYKNNYHLAYKIVFPTLTEVPMKPVYFVDAHTGKVINVMDTLVFYDVSGTVSLYEWEDPFTDYNQIAQPSAHNSIVLNNQQTDTTLIGTYQITGLTQPGTLTSYLEGPWVSVNNVQQARSMHSTYIDGQAVHNWDWSNDDTSYLKEEENTFYQVNRIHDYAEYVGATEMNYLMFANVNIQDHCNAYYDGVSINFFERGFSGPYECESTAVISDVIIHEYGHGIVDTLDPALLEIGGYWGESGNIHEGLSDYWACTINNNPNMSEGFFVGDQTPLRICNSDDRYPEDYNPEPHSGAQIISGAMWDIKEVIGKEVIDPMLVNALRLQPITFSELLETFLIADDDNNNMGDGTPHIDIICNSFFDKHGIWNDYCAHHTENPYVSIALPKPYSLHKKNATINISGTVAGAVNKSFISYSIEWAEGEYPFVWHTEGIILADGGTQEVVNGELGQFNTSYIGNQGFYSLKLAGYFEDGGYAEKRIVIYVDEQLKPGWPLNIGDAVTNGNFVAADVDNNGYKELIFPDRDWTIHNINHNGVEEPGWPVQLNKDCSWDPDCFISAPSLVDIDRDGDLEIFLYTTNINSGNMTIYGFHHNGSNVQDWPQHIYGAYGWGTNSLAIADLNHDDVYEILVPVIWGNLYIFNQYGNQILSFHPQSSVLDTGVSVGNLDNDPDYEIVFSAYQEGVSRQLYAININGTIVNGWPVTYVTDQDYYGPWGIFVNEMPAIGELDNDGINEVVLSYPGKLNVYNSNGSIQEGSWPHYEQEINYAYGPPILADIDSDDDKEILFKDWATKVYAFNHDGSTVDGWPVYLAWPSAGILSLAAGDINSDGYIEITANSVSNTHEHDHSYVYIWDKNGSRISGWPKPIASDVTYDHDYYFSPVITDIDNDGINELVVVSATGDIYIWEISGGNELNTQEWPTYQHDERHTGNYNAQCTDKTYQNECSRNKPFYCEQGTLVKNCQLCGCPPQTTCRADGTCRGSGGKSLPYEQGQTGI